MKAFLSKVLKFFNLTDRGGNLSITNIAVIVLITKMAIAPFDWPTAAALFMSLLNYSHKRSESAKAEKNNVLQTMVMEASSKAQFTQERVDALKEQITVANDALGKIVQIDEVKADMEKLKEAQEQVYKLAEEVKKVVSSANLGMAFRPPVRKNQENK